MHASYTSICVVFKICEVVYSVISSGRDSIPKEVAPTDETNAITTKINFIFNDSMHVTQTERVQNDNEKL